MCTFGIYARDFTRKRDYPSHRPSMPVTVERKTEKPPLVCTKKRVLRTYSDWKALGFHVRKGEKHVGRDSAGWCLFSSTQVEKNKSRYYGYRGDEDFDEDDYNQWYATYGCDRDWI